MDETTVVPQLVADNAVMAGTDVLTYTRERPGMSAFALEDGVVYHAYSTYARGLDGLRDMYQWLDPRPRSAAPGPATGRRRPGRRGRRIWAGAAQSPGTARERRRAFR